MVLEGTFDLFLHLLVHLVELVGPVDVVVVAFFEGHKRGHDGGVDVLGGVGLGGEVVEEGDLVREDLLFITGL